jgi:hypothetical protein
MKKLLLGLALCSNLALAGGQDHRCQGGHNCNEGGNANQIQGQIQGQIQDQHQYQGQAQGQTQGNINVIDINVESPQGVAQEHAGSVNTLRGGDIDLSGAGGEGGAGGSATAATGDASATGGDVDISTSTNLINQYDTPAASASQVYTQYCQRGGSGQIDEGGSNIVNSDQFCDEIRRADRMVLAYNACVETEGLCTDEQKNLYIGAYHEALAKAESLVLNTHHTGFVGRIFDQLSIPAAILALLLI